MAFWGKYNYTAGQIWPTGQCLTPMFYRIIKVLSDSASVFICAETVDSCVCVCAHLQRFYKKTAAFVMRAVAKHSPELSQAVVSSGGVAALVLCLEELDPGVKEAATWALSCIARHSERKGTLTSELADLLHLFLQAFFPLVCPHAALSQAVVDAGAIPLLLLCLREPEMSLKRIAAATLSDICKHTPELAQAVVDNCAITHLSQLILNKDTKLKVSLMSVQSRLLNMFMLSNSPLGHKKTNMKH